MLRFSRLLGLSTVSSFALAFAGASIAGLFGDILSFCSIAFMLSIAIAVVLLFRNAFLAPVILFASAIAAITGGYLPYQLGLWGLTARDYNGCAHRTCDANASGYFVIGLILASVVTVFGGLILGLAIIAARAAVKHFPHHRQVHEL